MIRALSWRRILGGGETQPQLFQCDDDNEWVVKLAGNPHVGTGGLCADWIGSVLAGQLGVPVLECALIDVDDAAIATMDKDRSSALWATTGVAFGSRYLSASKDVLGMEQILACSSTETLVRIAVVDTWLDVLDRQKPVAGAWNLLEDASEDVQMLRVIDFGLALTELFVPVIGSPTLRVRCPDARRVYLDRDSILSAIEVIRNISHPRLRTVAESIPPDWRAAAPKCQEAPDSWLTVRPGSMRVSERRDTYEK